MVAPIIWYLNLPREKKALKINRHSNKIQSKIGWEGFCIKEGFAQKKGADFDKIFSQKVNVLSIQIVLRLIGRLYEFVGWANECENDISSWKFGRGDVYKTTCKDFKSMVYDCWSKRSDFYSLKQAPRDGIKCLTPL